MSDLKYVENLNLVLSDRTDRDEEDCPGEFGLAVEAYYCGGECVNDSFWDTTELMTEIIRKFRYAIMAVMIEKGYTQDGFCSDYDIIVEPCYEDTTTYVAIRRRDKKVILHGFHKAWHFGHDSEDHDEALEELEEFLNGLATEFEDESDA